MKHINVFFYLGLFILLTMYVINGVKFVEIIEERNDKTYPTEKFVSELTYDKTKYGAIRGAKSQGYYAVLLDDGSMVYSALDLIVKIDLTTGECIPICEKTDCSHSPSRKSCISRAAFGYMCTDGENIYGVNILSRREIRKIDGDKITCLYTCNSDIINLWIYDDYFYISTMKGFERLKLGSKKSEIISSLPIYWDWADFYNENIYFIDESYELCSMGLDGKDYKVIYNDEKVTVTQIIDNKVYFRCVGGEEISDCGVLCYDIDTGSIEKVLEEKIWRYTVTKDGIYYTTVPNEKSMYNSVFCGLVTSLMFYDFETGVSEEIIGGINGEFIKCADSDYYIVGKNNDEYAEKYLKENPGAMEIDGYGEFIFNAKNKELQMIDVY